MTDATRNQTAPEDAADIEALSGKDLAAALALQLWDEFLDETETRSEDEREESRRIMKMFSDIYGAGEKSRAAFMFAGFYEGIGKGLELAQRLFGIPDTAKEDSSH